MKFYPVLLLIMLLVGDGKTLSYPKTKTDNIVDTYHGVTVPDPYRWLENWDDPNVKKWNHQQNAVSRNYLDELPNRDKITKEIKKIKSVGVEKYYKGSVVNNRAYFIKDKPPKQHAFFIGIDLDGNKGSESIVFDPEQFDASGNTSISWYRVSPNGKFVAIALTQGGSEVSDLHVFETFSGMEVDVTIPRVNGPTAGGDLEWLSDSSGFYYTRYPRPGERANQELNFFQQVWFHRLGEKLKDDRYELGKDFPSVSQARLQVDTKSGQLLVTMQYGDSGRYRIYLRQVGGRWVQLTDYDDEVIQAAFIDENRILLLSRKSAPKGKVLLMSLDVPSIKQSKVIIPELDVTITNNFYSSPTIKVHNEKIYIIVSQGGPMEVWEYDLAGNNISKPKLPPFSGVKEMLSWGSDGVLIRQSSYLETDNWYVFDSKSKETKKHSLSWSSPINLKGYRVTREFSVSKDGTKIPINIISKAGIKLDGDHPVLLTAYGGFGVNKQPRFDSVIKLWLDQGGIFAEANIRGGSEYGEDWHRQGMLTNKQNVFDDFISVMKYLVQKGYTNPKKLAIKGGSNGGLLMGAMLVQQPNLFRVAIAEVGLFDSLRYELSPNGKFNIPEFGTVKNKNEFKALYAYSPYHNVKSKVNYPSVFFTTGENDGRVDPMHSRKMIAKLQSATRSKNPILLHTSGTAGHGYGTSLSESIRGDVDMFSFLFSELGLNYKKLTSIKDRGVEACGYVLRN